MTRALTVVGCYAHPDDETWSISGSMALLVPKGVRCAVWTATRGEAGEISPGTGVPRAGLGQAREAEERAALALLGVREVEFGGFADGAVADADQAELARAVQSFLERLRPDVVVTMDRGGITAHPDHVAVTRATEAAFTAYLPGDGDRGREPRLYQQGVPKSQLDRARDGAGPASMDLPGEDEPYAPRGTPDELFSCHVDVSAVVDLRLRALREHRTQLAIGIYQLVVSHPEEMRWWLGTESFIRVHPAPHPGEPLETSLIEAFAP